MRFSQQYNYEANYISNNNTPSMLNDAIIEYD